LDRFAAAAAESLVRHAASQLGASLRPRRERLLPHLSPGCGGWDLADQHRLLGLLSGSSPGPSVRNDCGTPFGPLTLMPSGALQPPHSLLAAFGITDLAVRVRPLVACGACDLDPCEFRRAPAPRPDFRRRVTS